MHLPDAHVERRADAVNRCQKHGVAFGFIDTVSGPSDMGITQCSDAEMGRYIGIIAKYLPNLRYRYHAVSAFTVTFFRYIVTYL